MAKNKHIGSSFDDFLRNEGMLEEVDARVQKRVIADELRRAMKVRKLSENQLAKRMETSRTVVRALLDPENSSATLNTLARAAGAVGCQLSVNLTPVPPRRRRSA